MLPEVRRPRPLRPSPEARARGEAAVRARGGKVEKARAKVKGKAKAVPPKVKAKAEVERVARAEFLPPLLHLRRLPKLLPSQKGRRHLQAVRRRHPVHLVYP